jgi:hypothetical protein
MRSAPRLGSQATDVYSLERGRECRVDDCACVVGAGHCATGRRRRSLRASRFRYPLGDIRAERREA